MTRADIDCIKNAFERGIALGRKQEKRDMTDWDLNEILRRGIDIGTVYGRELGRDQARKERRHK